MQKGRACQCAGKVHGGRHAGAWLWQVDMEMHVEGDMQVDMEGRADGAGVDLKTGDMPMSHFSHSQVPSASWLIIALH